MNIFDRAAASIRSRIVQPHEAAHFEKTKYGKALSKLKNIHSGRRCFLIGNGPSLRADDLTRLHENGEITFAFNRIYNIFDSTPWRPTYYISQDEKMLGGCADTVDHLDLANKLIPIQLKWYHDISIHDATYFNVAYQQAQKPEDIQFSDEIPKEVFCAATCVYTAAQFAAYMGVREMFLIGVDHHFQISRNNRGEIIVDNTAKDYFTEKYNEDKAKLDVPNTENSTLTYIAMKKQCERRGISVFNATRGGRLEVFERVSFDSLFIGGSASR